MSQTHDSDPGSSHVAAAPQLLTFSHLEFYRSGIRELALKPDKQLLPKDYSKTVPNSQTPQLWPKMPE
ncbi:hypothetical protein ACTXT7_014415 [Hymenolepis weldensis]